MKIGIFPIVQSPSKNYYGCRKNLEKNVCGRSEGMFEFDEDHQMILEKIYPTGAQEWFCEGCSRRLLIQLEPIFSFMVLTIGDDNLPHTRSTDALPIEDNEKIADDEADELPEDLLEAVEDALKHIDFDW
jgi:hypothetical protein